MFSNPVYNLPPQFNENSLSQNLAGLSLNLGQSYQDQQQKQNLGFGSYAFPHQQQKPIPVEIGGYVPPSLNDSNTKWPSPDDVNASYQRGSTAVRQYNNSTIDDYYKKFVRPITDYVPISTNGQPTYVYQNLDGQPTTAAAPIQQSVSGGEIPKDPSSAASQSKEVEEKKHKKKHKKRSSKHGHSEKPTEEQQKSEPTIESTDHQQAPPIVASGSTEKVHHHRHHHHHHHHKKQQEAVPAAPAPPGNQLGGVGPQVPMRHESNPVVYFDIEIDGDARGRLVMELFRHVLPRTTQNFLALCLNEHGFGYRYSYFHRIIPGFMAQGGDFEKSNGTGGYSIYGEKFDDEGFPYPHDRPGLLSMANSGPNTNGSQFFLTFAACSHLDKKHVVFGQVLQGFHLLKDLELSGSNDGEVSREVKIANCGQLQ